MAQVSVTKTIGAPADRVWAMVSEWGGTSKWVPGVGPVTVEGSGVGALRSADLDPATGFPGRVSERLERFDSDAMHFRYRIIGESPLPVTDYVAEMRVEAEGAGAARVTWSSTWEAAGRPEAEIRGLLEGLYQVSLENVAKALA